MKYYPKGLEEVDTQNKTPHAQQNYIFPGESSL